MHSAIEQAFSSLDAAGMSDQLHTCKAACLVLGSCAAIPQDGGFFLTSSSCQPVFGG